MANFFLIDQSLRGSGGHHADYTSCIAQAAREMGFSTTIGANVGLQDTSDLDEYGNVNRVFRKTIYQRESYLAGLRHLTRSKPHPFLKAGFNNRSLARRAWDFFQLHRHKARRERLIRSFAVDCEKFFRDTLFTDSDHAFLTAVSEIELMGLAAFLANQPRTLQVQWHLQFHFNLFEGRTPEYGSQLTTARLVQSCFDAALARIPYHAVHFYTTSETLAEQYNRLSVGSFESLPYPISPCFRSDPNRNVLPIRESAETATLGTESDAPASEPIKITCPGQPRREKGFVEYLQPLVNKVWDSHLEPGRVQFVVQRRKRKWFQRKKLDIKLPSEIQSDIDPVEYRPHPLPENDYINLLKSSDCGMLFYDSRVYYSRRAGILGEMLSCGKPVIVPAGSWLSDQIQPSIQTHVESVLETAPLVRNIGLDQLDWDKCNVPLPGGICSFDDERCPFTFRFEPADNEDSFAVDFRWHWPESPGIYCRIDVTQRDTDGNEETCSQIVGQLRDSKRTSALFNIAPGTQSVEVKFRNAFHNSNASLRQLKLVTIDSAGSSLPTGAVGIVATDVDALDASISELVEHYAHYRDTAKSFSRNWYLSHEPKRTIARLLSQQEAFAKSA